MSRWFTVTIVDDLTLRSTEPDTTELTTPILDDGSIAAQQGRWLPSTIECPSSNLTVDNDADSIGRQTLDEFADAQEESRDVHFSHEGEESNSNTGECLF